jgi:capsular exopolysaccharide synthesis family protein
MFLLVLAGLAAGLVYYTYTRSVYYTRALVKLYTIGYPIESGEEYDIQLKYFTRAFGHRAIQEHAATRMGLTADYTSYEVLTDKFIQKMRLKGFDSGTMILETWAFYPSLAAAWPKAMVEGYNDYVKQTREGRRSLLNTVFKEEVSNLTQLSKEQADGSFSFAENHNVVEMFIEKRELEQIPADILRIRELLKARKSVEDTLRNKSLSVEERLSVLSRFEEEYPAIGSMVDNAPPLAPPPIAEKAKPNRGLPPADAPRSTVVVIPSIVNRSDDWISLLDERKSLMWQRADLTRTFLDGHPQVIALDKKILDLDGRLEGELTVLQNRFTLETEKLRSQERALVSQLPEVTKFQRDFDEFERERELFFASQLPAHESAIELQKQIGLAAYTINQDRFTMEFLRVVEERLTDPVSPSKRQGLFASLALGLGMAIGIPLLMERIRSWSSRVDELEEVTGLPALGVVSDNPDVGNLEIDPDEAFRIVRAGILFGSKGARPAQIILITSARPQEGKTTIATRLAFAMAYGGGKTVLVDADLRRGRIHRTFDMERTPGLSDYLSGEGEIDWESIVYTPNPEMENLSVIPTGRVRNDAPEVLEKAITSELIDHLKKRFDHIIIDAPPILGLADCYPLQELSDGVVFVIRSNFSTYSEASSSVQSLAASGAKFFGFVLNRVNLDSPDNYYYYYTYQPRYYAPRDYLEESSELAAK